MFHLKEQAAEASERRRIDAEETNWVASRDRCGSDINCIGNAYRTRILTLESQVGERCLPQQRTALRSTATPPVRQTQTKNWCDQNPVPCWLLIIGGGIIVNSLINGSDGSDGSGRSPDAKPETCYYGTDHMGTPMYQPCR